MKLNPNYAIDRGIRRNLLGHLTFQKASPYHKGMPAFSSRQSNPICYVSVLTSIARFGLKCICFLVVFLFFSSFVYASGVTVDLDSNSLDAGRVDEGVVLAQSFFIQNNSQVPVKITVAALGCACFEVISPRGKIELLGGARQEVRFNFNTTGFNGKVSKFLYVYTSDKANPVIRVEVTAEVKASREKFINRFSDFSSLTILSAGFIDGINPCAFTVMVFFISFLTFAGYRKQDMLIVGCLFILAIYVTYVLIGFGLFKVLRGLENFAYFSRLFYYIIAGFSFVLGAVNLYDFWVYKKTKNPEKIVIKLPSLIKRKIQSTIREELAKGEEEKKSLFLLIIASLSCGFIISLLELFCTGQLYLPTILYILKFEALKFRAIFYLLLYNAMFIVPLIAVFILSFFGFGSLRFEKIACAYLGWVKIATAFVFFLLGTVLLIWKG